MLAFRLATLFCFLHLPSLMAQDADVLAAIKDQAFTRSEAAEDVFYLADVFGPRFMDSPGYVRAGEWAVERLRAYGLTNVAKEYFTKPGPGWGFNGVSVEMILPSYSRMGAFPLARSVPTSGVVSGEPILAAITTEQEYQQFVARYQGKLKGKIVLMDQIQPIQARSWEGTHTLNESEVIETTWPPSPSWRPTMTDAQYQEMERLQAKTAEFLASQSVGVEIRSGIGDEDFPADAGVIRGTYSAETGKTSPPAVVVEAEQYNRLVRLVSHSIPVELRISTSTSFYDVARSFNVVAEIPGTDKPDEIVMVGAHLDSWQGGTGAVDNAAGCAIVMEAMRVLRSIHAPLSRSIRMVLWDGEEQNEAGSKAYVKAHFGDAKTGSRLPEFDKISVYFNVDSGSGKIRGFVAQKNTKVQNVLESWIKPLRDLGVIGVSGKQDGGSDHIAFEKIGIPTVPSKQDPLDYDAVAHHTNMDVADRVQPEDMKQAVTALAWMLIQASNASDMMPRVAKP
ncbi:MAG TPA: M28 family peptidase [Candidatus Angelobacter sp.]|nr:M28 family peptidase [Candidatus Angelobacter sp.]